MTSSTPSAWAEMQTCIGELGLRENLYYGSGFPNNGGPARLPQHSTFDLSIGKSVGESWSFSVQAMNVANRRFLLDNSLTFGGTHYFESRQIYGEVRHQFHF
jgi:hypothetical protein